MAAGDGSFFYVLYLELYEEGGRIPRPFTVSFTREDNFLRGGSHKDGKNEEERHFCRNWRQYRPGSGKVL